MTSKRGLHNFVSQRTVCKDNKKAATTALKTLFRICIAMSGYLYQSQHLPSVDVIVPSLSHKHPLPWSPHWSTIWVLPECVQIAILIDLRQTLVATPRTLCISGSGRVLPRPRQDARLHISSFSFSRWLSPHTSEGHEELVPPEEPGSALTSEECSASLPAAPPGFFQIHEAVRC